jgi:hypothetical protein
MLAHMRRSMIRVLLFLPILACLIWEPSVAAAADPEPEAVPVGVATIDITPNYPIRLVGYSDRKTESDGIASRLKARALAIGADASPTGEAERGGGPSILIAVDNLGVAAAITEVVADRLKAKTGIPRERLAICSTHTHCAPTLSGGVSVIFGGPLPPDQQGRIDRYTRELTDALETVALRALADRKPGKLSWSQGTAKGIAANRRMLEKGKWVGFGVNPNGPTDPSLPVLKVTDESGAIRAVLMGFACHCTTLGGSFNKICAEWAGYACDAVEAAHPGATAMVVIGCGADANPEPRRNLDDAKTHGATIAREANRLLSEPMTPLGGTIRARLKRIELPLSNVPTKAQLEQRVHRPAAEGYFARILLDQINRGQSLPNAVPYVIQTWCFGDSLAMVFLAGEVVVDYTIRLKWETDSARLWINAYSNDVPCYIPSRRISSEGGYEVDLSMIFYGRAGRIALESEDRIISTVHDLLPAGYSRAGRR